MDIAERIRQAVGKAFDNIKLLILVNDRTGSFNYLLYKQEDFVLNDAVAIEQMFDGTEQLMQSRNKEVFATVQEIPMLAYVGQWNKTVVRKLRSGAIAISEPSGGNVDAHLGVGE